MGTTFYGTERRIMMMFAFFSTWGGTRAHFYATPVNDLPPPHTHPTHHTPHTTHSHHTHHNMKRAYCHRQEDDEDDDSYQSSDSDECSFGESAIAHGGDHDRQYSEEEDEDDNDLDDGTCHAHVTTIAHEAHRRIIVENELRDDRPYLLTTPSADPPPTYFDYHPHGNQVDPLATGSMVTDISPYGSTLGTLEYNLRHAIERIDDHRMAACLTEFFRHFVLLNRPIRRFVPRHLERDMRLAMATTLGPFSTHAAFGMHQRLLAMLLGICVRQVGVATPTMISFLLGQWKVYERVLFHRPAQALAVLVRIGTTLCHCKKDASVAYTRHVFEDTSKMREWRLQVLKHPDTVSAYIPSAEQVYNVRKMLLCNKVYFNNRLRLRRYQTVCIGSPHPEYMCQGGCMQRTQILGLVDGIKQGLPPDAGPDATGVVQDMEDVMIYLAGHVNNMYDRDAFDTLQVDLQILLYLFHRVLCEQHATGMATGSNSLMMTSKRIVLAAPNHVMEAYAQLLWNTRPDMVHLIKYGVLGEPLVKAGRRAKRKTLSSTDLLDTFHPEIVPKVHEWAPPSILRDDDNICREYEQSEVQRHPAVQSLRFLFALYRLHHMWAKCTSSKLLMAHDQAGLMDRVVVDREFYDATQPTRLLYQCQATGVCAAEVYLQGNVAMEIARKWANPLQDVRVERIPTTDAGEAEIFADHLCRPDDTGGKRAMKAVVVGPWPLQDAARLEQDIARHHRLKQAVSVHPDAVFVKKMMFLEFSGITGNTHSKTQHLGRTYAWVVYVPSVQTAENHVVMTIHELKGLAHQDATLAKTAKSILRPMNLVRPIAVMKRICGEFCHWKVGANYVSFTVTTEGTNIVLRHIRIHTITETLLDKCPDYRYNDARVSDNTTTATVLHTLLEKCRSSQYANANSELAHCERLLNQVST